MQGINSTRAQQIIHGWIIVKIRCRYNIINISITHYTKYTAVQIWSSRLIWLLKSRSELCCTLVVYSPTVLLWPMATPLHHHKPFLSTPRTQNGFLQYSEISFSLNSNAGIALSSKKPNGKVNTYIAFWTSENEHVRAPFLPGMNHVLWKENITLNGKSRHIRCGSHLSDWKGCFGWAKSGFNNSLEHLKNTFPQQTFSSLLQWQFSPADTHRCLDGYSCLSSMDHTLCLLIILTTNCIYSSLNQPLVIS